MLLQQTSHTPSFGGLGLNYGRTDYDDSQEDHYHDVSQADEESGYKPWHLGTPDDDYDEEDFADGIQEAVEYQADHATDDSADDFDVRFGWRSKRGRGQRGRFVPPDRRGLMAPVFVSLEISKPGPDKAQGEKPEL